MKKANLTRAMILCCVVMVGASCVFAQDWPQWRGAERDGKVTGFKAPAQWPDELKLRWKTTVGTGDSTPAMVGDKLYVFSRQGDDEIITSLDAASGKELWSEKYPAQAVTGAASRHPGPRSSPAVADGKVVLLGVGGVVSCFDAANGKLLWRKDPFPKTVPRFFTSYSPVIVDGMAIVHLGGPGNGAAVAYDLASGNEKWRWAKEGPDYGSPVLLTVDGTKQIASPTEKSVVGISVANGKLLWQYPFPLARMAYNAFTPIVDNQTIFITGVGRGTKALKIEKQGDSFAANELWSNPDLATQFNTPVLKDDLLFGLSDRNKLYCINAKTGKTNWTDEASHGSRGFGSIIDAGSCMAVLTNDSELTFFKSDGKACSLIKSYKVSETPIYAHPVIAGNRIFIKDQDNVTMFVVE